MENKTTLVLGASEKPDRYSNMAARLLRSYNHTTYLVGTRAGNIDDQPIHTEFPTNEPIDTVTLYVNPTNQTGYIEHILKLKPRRIIFNPGTENPDFEELATQNGIEATEACTLVLLRTGQY